MNLLGSSLSSIKPRLDDSGCDRLSYYYSTMIIMVMSVTITARQYVGSPLQCWVPAQFTGAWEQYAENYCFVYNTFWVKPDEEIPESVDERTQAQLIYYQWVPFIMAIEAGFFYLPALFWSKVSRKAGLNIEALVKMAVEAEESSAEKKREENIATICTHLENSLQLQAVRQFGVQSTMTRYAKFGLLEGRYIANMYLVTKFVYLGNLVGQFLMQNQFLGQHNHLWGASILHDIIHGTDWELSGNFPRIAVCDFQAREKKSRERYRYIKVASQREDVEYYLDKFCKHQVNPDMVVVFKMITEHSSEIITAAILNQIEKKEVVPDGITSKKGEESEASSHSEHSPLKEQHS